MASGKELEVCFCWDQAIIPKQFGISGSSSAESSTDPDSCFCLGRVGVSGEEV